MRIICACLFVLVCCPLRAQTGDIAFDAASVKISQPAPDERRFSRMTGGPGSNDPGRFDWVNASLITVVMQAYEIRGYQVSGPDWLNDVKVDIAATLPKGATREQFLLMLRHLLAERFQLKVHHENREGAAYSLVLAKGGPKMKESADEPFPVEPAGQRKMVKDEDGFPLPPARAGVSQVSDGSRIRLRARKEPMSEFAATWLTTLLNHPVTDDTGLAGKYDFILTYANQSWTGAATPESETTVDLLGAMAQLGLRLEQKKAPIDTLVIDHMEKAPTAN